jgi:TolA-binding protein
LRKSAAGALVVALFVASCGLSGTKKQYVLAEKLWTDGNYAASVSEFDRVYSHDPHGALGLQALYRAATTQAYFLSQYADAVKKLSVFAQLTPDKDAAWNAKVQMGEILSTKMGLYAEAISHYRSMLAENPKHPDAPLYTFKIGQAQFFLLKFSEALRTYQDLIRTYPSSAYAERAMYELGTTYFTEAEQHSDKYQDAIDAYERFLKKYPKSEWASQAQFGVASCLEEMDQLDAAYNAYEALKYTYPSPNVITIKLVRIRERKAQRSH